MNQPGFSPSDGHFGPAAAPPIRTGHVEGAQEIIDSEHLKLLRIGYFISAGQTAIVIPLGLMYAGMGAMFARMPMGRVGPVAGAPPEQLLTWIFGMLGTVMAGCGVLGAGLKLVTAMRLKTRRSRTLCLITAGISCLEIPYGTALGIMTFMVLGRPSVRRLFDDAPPSPSPYG
jgi:hypothetical protein